MKVKCRRSARRIRLTRYWLKTFANEFANLIDKGPLRGKVDKKLARAFAESLAEYYTAKKLPPKRAAEAEYERQLRYVDFID